MSIVTTLDLSPSDSRVQYCDYETKYTVYEGWNFNSGNYLFTTDTK